MTMQEPPENPEEDHQHGHETDDTPNKVFGPSQSDMDRSWEGYETGDSGRRPNYRGALWKVGIVVVSLVILASMTLGIIGPLVGNSRNSEPVQPERVAAEVLRVIDGRTIVVDAGGGEQTVRLIGVETPLFGHPFYDVARQVTQNWIDGKDILLESDQGDANEQGHLLRYVFLDGIMVNAALIRNGLGKAETVHPNVEYNSFLVDMERQARESGTGMWDPVYSESDPADLIDTEARFRQEFHAGPSTS